MGVVTELSEGEESLDFFGCHLHEPLSSPGPERERATLWHTRRH